MISGADGDLIRRINSHRVLTEIRRRGEVARVDIAAATDLSRATVTAVTAELLDAGLIETAGEEERGEAAPTGRGRPRVLLRLNPAACHVAGVKISMHQVAVWIADFAGEQGRDVFAVPGSILVRGSAGTNRLIQDGATAVLGPEDILEEMNLTMVVEQVEARQVLPADDTEAVLLSQLSTEPVHVDELQRQLELPIAQVTSTLALMELKGMVRQVGGMNYVLAREGRVEYVVD